MLVYTVYMGRGANSPRPAENCSQARFLFKMAAIPAYIGLDRMRSAVG